MSDAKENGSARRWPRWKVVGVYLAMFGLAVWSIWMIDSHVLQVAAEARR